MNPLLLGPLFELGTSLIDRWFPDPAKKAEAEFKLLEMAQSGDLTKIMEQLKINAIEAAHPSIFVAGPRPFIMWICGFGLLYQTIIHNILEWVASIMHWPLPPAPDTETLIYVLCTLLGIGTLRTVEKVKGVAAK